jgi:hypothetical protein
MIGWLGKWNKNFWSKKVLTTDQIERKREIEDKVRKELPKQLPETWSKLDNQGKENLIQHQTNYLHAGLTEFEDAIKDYSFKIDQMLLFLVGLFLGIVGGLLSNIVHDYLKQFGIFYIVGSIIVFIFLLFLIVQFYFENASYSLKSTKALRALQKKAIQEIEKRKTIGL